jgi:NADH dehydrogenase
VEVAGRAGLRRVLMVSYPGASPDEPNPTLRALGLAEELVAGCGVEHLVVRCTHVIGAGSPWLSLVTSLARRRPAVVIGSGSQRLAPVLAEDVARVLAAADDRAQAVTGTVGLQGPEEITADRLVGLLAGPRRWKRHVDGVSGLGSAAADLLRRDSLADAPDAAAELGVSPGPFRPALSPSRAG